MRAKRRTKSEIQKSGRKSNAHKPVPDELKKVDISKNNEDLNVEAIAEAQRNKEKKLVPMRINARTVIYVTADKNNEEYKQRWILKHEGERRSESDASKIAASNRKKVFDKFKAVEMLTDAYSVRDISKEVMASADVLYRFFKEEDIHIPNARERIEILHRKGFNLNEIIYRTNLKRDVVIRHYKHL